MLSHSLLTPTLSLRWGGKCHPHLPQSSDAERLGTCPPADGRTLELDWKAASQP